jgi:hypothetical protein
VRLKLTKATLLAKQKIATSGDTSGDRSSGVQEFRSGGVVEWWSGGVVEGESIFSCFSGRLGISSLPGAATVRSVDIWWLSF